MVQHRDGVTVSDDVRIGIRTYFAGKHLGTAHILGQECHAIECAQEPSDWQQILDRYHAFAIGAVLASVAGLEAAINELFLDAIECQSPGGASEQLKGLDASVVASLAALWKSGVDKLGTLEKYNVALVLAGHPVMERGAQPWQDAAWAIKLTNHLVHHKPQTEWLGDRSRPEREQKKPLLIGLHGKFNESPFAKTADPFFPKKCLGAGCASWALSSIKEFLGVFHGQLGTTPGYLKEETRP